MPSDAPGGGTVAPAGYSMTADTGAGAGCSAVDSGWPRQYPITRWSAPTHAPVSGAGVSFIQNDGVAGGEYANTIGRATRLIP